MVAVGSRGGHIGRYFICHYLGCCGLKHNKNLVTKKIVLERKCQAVAQLAHLRHQTRISRQNDRRFTW